MKTFSARRFYLALGAFACLMSAAVAADLIVPIGGTRNEMRYKDMGDGTFAEVVAAVGTFSAEPPVGGATEAKQDVGNTSLATALTDLGAPGAVACATDTGSCNFNQLFQRIAQRLTTINTTLGTPMQATGGTVGPSTTAVGSGTANATTPFAAQMMVSDGTNLQRVFAPLALGDGVNGNNMVAGGGWGWNGTAWDRLRTDTTAGLWVQNKAAIPAGAAVIGKVGIDQTTPGTTDSVTVKPQSYTAVTSITLATGAAHIANDVVGAAAAAITFTGICPAASREAIITSAALEYDTTAIPASMTSFRLYLYNVTPPSALADDAPFDLPAGDRASFLGYVDLGSPADLGSTLYVESNGIQKQLTCASANLFGYLVTAGAYTTVTSDVVKITLHAVAP